MWTSPQTLQNTPRHPLTAIHSLLVWHWNWNRPHGDFTVEAVLVLVTSANLTPSGGIVDVDGAIVFSDDLQETWNVKHVIWRLSQPSDELTSDMHSMDVSNWLILTRSVKALVWVSAELLTTRDHDAERWGRRSCSLSASWTYNESRREVRSGTESMNQCSEKEEEKVLIEVVYTLEQKQIIKSCKWVSHLSKNLFYVALNKALNHWVYCLSSISAMTQTWTKLHLFWFNLWLCCSQGFRNFIFGEP